MNGGKMKTDIGNIVSFGIIVIILWIMAYFMRDTIIFGVFFFLAICLTGVFAYVVYEGVEQ